MNVHRKSGNPHFIKYVFLFLSVLLFTSCQESETPIISGFKKLDTTSGFDFTNAIEEEKMLHMFEYINAYCGGGVAIGDINNDGLQDIFMTANMTSSKLFLNKGNMKFEDITASSGTSTEGWCTGVTMGDVNNDGWLDIYVCRSYHKDPTIRTNKLFINNKDNTFVDLARMVGVDDENYSIGASFFDYDRDGDLDLIVANHPRDRLTSLNWHYNLWKKPVKQFSNRLFRNDRAKGFVDVTKEAGILSYGFSLALTTSDIDDDGWPDIYITVDHDEPDIIFHNNQNGTFTNIVQESIPTSGLSSMGIDAGDINHDQYPDIMVAEMLAEDHYREKVNMSMQNVDRFNYLVDTLGYKYFQMHNFLYLNNGNRTFSDISQLANVAKSDWSWAVLFMDFDNDSWQDIYVTNGLFRNVFQRDKKQVLDSIMLELGDNKEEMKKIVQAYSLKAEKTRIKNYLFRNKGNLDFEKFTDEAGLIDKTISTGAAYGDLDNDGDLDLVVNDVGDPAKLYENIGSGNNYLRVKFEFAKEMHSMGAKVLAEVGGEKQSREIILTRGFQSSSEPFAHFGLGKNDQVDKLTVTWPDGKSQMLENIKANQTISIIYQNAKRTKASSSKTSLVNVVKASDIGIDFIHKENTYRDYDDQVLLPHRLSEYGPFISTGDVNGDKIDDIYLGGAAGQSGTLYTGSTDHGFHKLKNPSFVNHRNFEDGHSELFDADGDGDLDLAVASSGYEFAEGDEQYQSRLYLNDGDGNFTYDPNALPDHRFSGSSITSVDLDSDGDLDLLLGGRLVPKKYPLPGKSAILINDGVGNFSNETATICKELENFGMVKDALWTDINGDQKMDLIVVGEWTPISIFINKEDKLVNATAEYFEKPLLGWWNCIYKSDLDGDGIFDYAVGNLGSNYKYKATHEKPFVVYGKDFDNSGSSDIVLGTYYGDKMYPVRGKNCSSEQIPDLKEKFPSFEEFALADIDKVYGEELDDALKYEANEFSSIILYGEIDGSFTVKKMPREVQIAPVNGIAAHDFNSDNKKDLLVAGNMFQSEIETGRADSGTGYILLNDGNRSFRSLPVHQSGLYLPQDVKSVEAVNGNFLIGINNEAPLVVVPK